MTMSSSSSGELWADLVAQPREERDVDVLPHATATLLAAYRDRYPTATRALGGNGVHLGEGVGCVVPTAITPPIIGARPCPSPTAAWAQPLL